MKKFISVLLILFLITFIGCSKEVSNEKTEEELKAEIKAELEAEYKAELETESNEERILFASDLKEGDVIDGHIINTLIYNEGEDFGIGLNGEFIVHGKVTYDEEFWDEIILSVDNELASPTVIKFKFDEIYEISPPSGVYTITDSNLSIFETKIGSDFIAEIKSGKTLNVELVIDEYGYYTENHSSPSWVCNIVEIVSYDLE